MELTDAQDNSDAGRVDRRRQSRLDNVGMLVSRFDGG